jgi:hypothetical protein
MREYDGDGYTPVFRDVGYGIFWKVKGGLAVLGIWHVFYLASMVPQHGNG